MKPHARLWIDQAYAILMSQKRESFPKDAPIGLDIRLYSAWMTKSGTYKRSDLSNRIKLLEDVVAEVCGFDDSRVTSLSARKVQALEATHTEVDVWNEAEVP